jgi:predicted nucleic acid-binding Zn ribbon protein
MNGVNFKRDGYYYDDSRYAHADDAPAERKKR